MRIAMLTALVALFLTTNTATSAAQDARQVEVARPETFIPDLMQMDWVRLGSNETVVQFQFLRAFCGAGLSPPDSATAFRIVDARNRQREPFVVQRTEGVFSTWGPQACGRAGDTFRLYFAPLPTDITHINVMEGDGGYTGTWSWYNVHIRAEQNRR